MTERKIITIFGSSYPKPGDEEYEFAYQLGRELGKAGFDICNGGFYGTMEATAKGAFEVGAHTIGITVNSFNLRANKFIKKEIHFTNLFDRIQKIISTGDGYIVLIGGTGTLLEYSAIMELINKGLMRKKPVVAYKNFWSDLTKLMNQRNSFEGREEIKVLLSDDVQEIVSYFKKYFEENK